MRPELWPEVDRVLSAALEEPEAERRAWLARSCTDPEVRGEVEALLDVYSRAEGFLSRATVPIASGRLVNAQLGPYRVVGLIGTGGMGEVYRARDPRICRDVAIKILAAPFAADSGRLRRFLLEARAAGSLNHPNVMAIYDMGTYQDAPYLVCELLEGQTLRARLDSGALPPAKAIEVALGIARGLAAAHAKGIVHRDLKPENVFLTSGGQVKILDFGLARLMERDGVNSQPTMTTPGMILGTASYMSPEQVRGEPCDHRSDIFSFGSILSEMLRGERAFSGETQAETMTAVLKAEPPDPEAPHELLRILHRCLEKNPSERFQSASDLAFALESLVRNSGLPAKSHPAPQPARNRRLAAVLAAAVLLVMYTAGVYGVSRRFARTAPPSFHQLTFQAGTIWSARFAPDGRTVIYGAKWGASPLEIFMMRPESPESRALGLPNTEILAISSRGEMALSRGRQYLLSPFGSGTLASVPMAGGAPRDILDNVGHADWAPDGSSLAVIVIDQNHWRLEFPVGTVLHQGNTWLSDARVSPSGDSVAFIEHPLIGDDSGSVAVVDLHGVSRTLSSGWACVGGLAWSPGGKEVWFTAARTGNNRAVHAVSLSGKQRLVARAAGALVLQDISPAGLVLVARDHPRIGVSALAAGESSERDLTWLDDTVAHDITADGSAVLLDETGEGGGQRHSVYLRKLDGSPPVRLGDGFAIRLSPDARWALTMRDDSELMLLPTGAGTPRALPRASVHYQKTGWFPDLKRVAMLGNEPGHGMRLFLQDIAEGDPVPVTPEGITAVTLLPSTDGQSVLARGNDGRWKLFSMNGGSPADVQGLTAGVPVQWANEHEIFVFQAGGPPGRIDRFDLRLQRRSLWKELTPADSAGVFAISYAVVAPGGKAYAYSYRRLLSNLYLVEGLK
jgi:eukaryotic-like serine/threonine-protein kinase